MAPPQRQTTMSLRQRLQKSFGSAASSRSFVASTYSRGSGGQARKAAARREATALAFQRTQDKAKNKQIAATLARQRKRQAGLMKKARGAIKKTGKAARQDIKERGVKMGAAGEQQLISRGLGNTTVRSGFQRGVSADVSRNLTLQRDMQAQRMAGLFSREAGMAIPEGQLGLQGVGMQSGGLQDYMKLMMMMQGGLS